MSSTHLNAMPADRHSAADEKRSVAPLAVRLRPLIYLSPSLILLLGITIYPLLYSLYLATHTVILTSPQLSGWSLWKNLNGVFLSTPNFWLALRTTLILVVSCVTIEFVIGFALALAFTRSFRGRDLIFPFFLAPMMVTPVVVGVIWRYMFNGEFGFLAGIMRSVGIQNYSLLNNPETAIYGIIVADVWQWTPFMLLLLVAGLRALPKSPFEAARVDGASDVRIFFDLTVPLMAPVILIAVLIRGIDAFNRMFDIIYIMTNGGPGRATETLSIMAYRQSFQYFFMHQGAIIAIAMLIVITIMTKILMWYMNPNERA